MTAEVQSTAHRRRFQFSLRTLLLVMIPVAAIAAWLGAEYQKGRREKAAVARIEVARGSVSYDLEATQRDWRRQWLGEWYPDRVDEVSLCRDEHLGEGLFFHSWDTQDLLDEGESLAAFPYLKKLDLRNTAIGDLSFVSSFPELEKLNLHGLPVEELSPVADLSKLKWLDVSGTQISDLAAVAELSELEFLAAGATQVKDLTPLLGLKKLRRLVLYESQVSDLSPVRQLQTLWLLNVAGTPVSDLTPLAGHPRLQLLSLCNTQVTIFRHWRVANRSRSFGCTDRRSRKRCSVS